MPTKKNVNKSNKKEPIYTWAFKSSQPRAGGQVIDYIARLNEDGTISCNCPGWVFAKKGQERACKHTRKIASEAPQILKMFKAGEALPVLDLSSGSSGPTQPFVAPKGSNIKFGRVLDLED